MSENNFGKSFRMTETNHSARSGAGTATYLHSNRHSSATYRVPTAHHGFGGNEVSRRLSPPPSQIPSSTSSSPEKDFKPNSLRSIIQILEELKNVDTADVVTIYESLMRKSRPGELRQEVCRSSILYVLPFKLC